jgi:cbb3-type cytochrome oxidase subunit 3
MNSLESTAVGAVIGVTIFVLMMIFVGIWFWAWLPHHKKNFDLLARMPMLDLISPQSNAPTTKELVTSDRDNTPDEDNR